MSTLLSTDTAAPIAAERLAVLLIDDNEPDRVMLARLLRKQYGPRVRVWEAEDGRSGLEMLRRHKVDAVLVDYLMSDMDGLQLLDEMADARLDTAAIVVAGQASETLARRCAAAGADDFILKGDLDGGRLQSAISRAVQTRRLRRENAQMVRQLRRTNQEMEYLVRALSHDMSANFMLLESSFSQLKRKLGDSSGDASQPRPNKITAEIAAHVEACLGESKRFVNDLVRMAKTGSVDMEPQRVDLADVVDEVLFEQRERIAGRNVQVDLQRPLPVVWCNRQRAKQIFTNLIRNALRHGCDPQRPRITISQVSRAGGDDEGSEARLVSVLIHDNGPGIEQRFRDEVFLPGRRLPGASVEGSGMGLSIVRKIAEHYGGSARVDLDCTRGTGRVGSLPSVPADARSADGPHRRRPARPHARSTRQPGSRGHR